MPANEKKNVPQGPLVLMNIQNEKMNLPHYKWEAVIVFQCDAGSTNNTFQRIIGKMNWQFDFVLQ